MGNKTEAIGQLYPGLASPGGHSFGHWAAWLRDRGRQFDPYVQRLMFESLADWIEHLEASEAPVFGYWCKFADGSEEFRRSLPADPDCEDMASSYIPLYRLTVAPP